MANTPNLGLHQWAADDAFLREDFNEDLLKLDGAVGEKCRMACGTYTGNCTNEAIGSSNSQTVSLPFTPKAVIVHRQVTGVNASAPNISTSTGIALAEAPLMAEGYSILKIIDHGFAAGAARSDLGRHSPNLNANNAVYLYLAFQ